MRPQNIWARHSEPAPLGLPRRGGPAEFADGGARRSKPLLAKPDDVKHLRPGARARAQTPRIRLEGDICAPRTRQLIAERLIRFQYRQTASRRQVRRRAGAISSDRRAGWRALFLKNRPARVSQLELRGTGEWRESLKAPLQMSRGAAELGGARRTRANLLGSREMACPGNWPTGGSADAPYRIKLPYLGGGGGLKVALRWAGDGVRDLIQFNSRAARKPNAT